MNVVVDDEEDGDRSGRRGCDHPQQRSRNDAENEGGENAPPGGDHRDRMVDDCCDNEEGASTSMMAVEEDDDDDDDDEHLGMEDYDVDDEDEEDHDLVLDDDDDDDDDVSDDDDRATRMATMDDDVRRRGRDPNADATAVVDDDRRSRRAAPPPERRPPPQRRPPPHARGPQHMRGPPPQPPPQPQQQPPQPQHPPPDDAALDGYQRNDLIGQGAYGLVYRGTQRSTGTTVAIKRIPFADSTPEGGVPCSVIREISLLRELDHPNVVRLLDVLQARPGGLYLIFEYVAHDLKTFMDQYQTSDDPAERRGLPAPMVRSFMQQMLSGVAFCHTYRVLHRDLKPHNLLISADGSQLKLADFGLARLSGLPNGPYTHEVVTLWYRAPELLLGTNRYSAAVDVWSVGCILAEMASGHPLFPGRSDIDQLFKIFQRRGTPGAETWPAVVRLPHYNAEFPRWPARPVTDFVNLEASGPHAADLLTQILQYDPERRISCRAALQHAYFYE